MAERLRAFVAVELSEEVRGALDQVVQRLRRHVPSGVRWVSPEGIHLTLKFLGEIAGSQVEAVKAAMHQAAKDVGPFQLALNGTGAFPNSQAPRVLWVGLSGDLARLAELARALEQSLVPLGFPAEGRPFTPHLTLGRTREGMSAEERRRLGQLLRSPVEVPPVTMPVRSISLIRSTLRPEGPQYTRLHEEALGSSLA